MWTRRVRKGRFIGDTHGSRVFISTVMEHRANQTAAASEAVIECNALLGNCKAKFAKSKVLNLLFLRFRSLGNSILPISLFSVVRFD